MPKAACRLPGTVYMVERRTERRVHLFRPDREMNQIFLYCLGIAAQRTNVALCVATLMSNHYHAIVVDRDGRVSEMMEILNGLLTKTTQALRGWAGRVFDGSGPSYVELTTPAAIIDKAGYVLANPTAAGLVRYSEDWPGVRTRQSEIGEKAIVIERPAAFFAEDGVMPESVEIPWVMPDVLVEIYGVKQTRRRIAESVERHEAEARAEAKAKGRGFKGAERVCKSSPYERATTREERHGLNPRYAGDAESIAAAIARDAVFCERYAAVRQRWLAGERDVVWPAGTDAMRRRHRVRCEPPG